jgi:hypothetical protein
MIIGSWERLDIGAVYGQDGKVGITDNDRRKHALPFLVIRVATFEEWEQERRAEGADVSNLSSLRGRAQDGFFYEVSVD